MTPSVSVLLPVRDGAATLGDAVQSIRVQSRADLELIVVDDGSRDDTSAILGRIAAEEPRLRVLRTEGSGIAAALALGLAHCRAPLVARMDADDLCDPERLARQLAFLEANPGIVLCGTHVEIAGLDGAAPGEGMARHAAWIETIASPADVRRELLVECPLVHPTFCFRRAPVDALGGYREGVFPEDYELVLRLAAHGHAMANVPRKLVTWRDGPDRASRRLPAYARAAFFRLKAAHLASTRLAERPAIVWGAGKVGRFFSRELKRLAVELAAFVDIDSAKWGRTVRGRPVLRPHQLGQALAASPRPLVIGAVGTLGARELIRDALRGMGLVEPDDFVMVA
jgi:glycosyltransferase involved in cell wall biosynthesis